MTITFWFKLTFIYTSTIQYFITFLYIHEFVKMFSKTLRDNKVRYLITSEKVIQYCIRTCTSTCVNTRLNCLFAREILRQVSRIDGKVYSTNSNKKENSYVPKDFKAMVDYNKQKFRNTEQRLKERGQTILMDIKETKNKVKEKMEEIIERENIYTIPNFLCVARMALSPYLGILVVHSEFHLALAVLGVAAVTDLLDGWIARKWKSQSSKMGSFLDPMADKILIGTLFLTLTYVELIPIMLTGIIIARDVALVTAGFVIRYRSLPPPRTLSRYFDVTHATAQLAPTFISKVNTGVQLLLVGTTIAAPVFHYIDHPLIEGLWYVTGITTIAAALSYILSKDTYKILSKPNVKKQ